MHIMQSTVTNWSQTVGDFTFPLKLSAEKLSHSVFQFKCFKSYRELQTACSLHTLSVIWSSSHWSLESCGDYRRYRCNTVGMATVFTVYHGDEDKYYANTMGMGTIMQQTAVLILEIIVITTTTVCLFCSLCWLPVPVFTYLLTLNSHASNRL